MLMRVVTDFNVFDIGLFVLFFFIICLFMSVDLLNCYSLISQAQLQYETISV